MKSKTEQEQYNAYLATLSFTCAKCGAVFKASEYIGMTKDPRRTAEYQAIYYDCPKKASK